MDGEALEFIFAVGRAARAKRQFRVGLREALSRVGTLDLRRR